MTGVLCAMAGGRTQPVITVTLDDYAVNWTPIDDYYISAPTVTATPSGGSSYTYSWETVSGFAPATSPTAATTDFFTWSGIAAVVRCVVTDVSGAVGVSPNCTIDP